MVVLLGWCLKGPQREKPHFKDTSEFTKRTVHAGLCWLCSDVSFPTNVGFHWISCIGCWFGPWPKNWICCPRFTWGFGLAEVEGMFRSFTGFSWSSGQTMTPHLPDSKDSKDSKVSPEVTRSSPFLSFFICGVSIYYVCVNMFVLVAWTASVSPLIACLPNRWLVSALHIGEENRLLSSTLGHLHLPQLGWSRACTLHWAKTNQNRLFASICFHKPFWRQLDTWPPRVYCIENSFGL